MSTDDRELLKLAARASGLRYHYLHIEHIPTANGVPWAPLTDDGDALRLAVKLRLIIDHGEHCSATGLTGYYAQATTIGYDISEAENYNSDPYAATRRAIVRAAAKIGEGMCQFPTAEDVEKFVGMCGKPEWDK